MEFSLGNDASDRYWIWFQQMLRVQRQARLQKDRAVKRLVLAFTYFNFSIQLKFTCVSLFSQRLSYYSSGVLQKKRVQSSLLMMVTVFREGRTQMVRVLILISLIYSVVSLFSSASSIFSMGLPQSFNSFNDLSFLTEHYLIKFSAKLSVTSEGRFQSSHTSILLYVTSNLNKAGRFFTLISLIWLKERSTDQISGAWPRSIEVIWLCWTCSYFRNGRLVSFTSIRRLLGATSFYSLGNFLRVRLATSFSFRQNSLRLGRLSKTASAILFPCSTTSYRFGIFLYSTLFSSLQCKYIFFTVRGTSISSLEVILVYINPTSYSLGMDFSEILVNGFWSKTINLKLLMSERETDYMLFLRRKRDYIELGRLMLQIEFRELKSRASYFRTGRSRRSREVRQLDYRLSSSRLGKFLKEAEVRILSFRKIFSSVLGKSNPSRLEILLFSSDNNLISTSFSSSFVRLFPVKSKDFTHSRFFRVTLLMRLL